MSLKLVIATFVSLVWFSPATKLVHAEDGDALITSVRALIGQTDSTAGRTTFTDVELLDYLSLAMTGIVGEAMDDESTVKFGGGDEENTLPSDFLALSGPAVLLRVGQSAVGEYVKLIQEVGSDSLSKMKTRPTEENMGPDNHVMFIQGGKLWILPALQSNDSVQVSYYSRPTIIAAGSGSTEVDVEVEWEYVITYGAAAICYAYLQDWNGYDRMIAERDKKLNALRTVQTIRKKALPNND